MSNLFHRTKNRQFQTWISEKNQSDTNESLDKSTRKEQKQRNDPSGVFNAIGTLVTGLNSSAVGIDAEALEKSRDLSLQEIDARVAYYKAVSAAERSAKETKSDTATKRTIQDISYVYTAAMYLLDQKIQYIIEHPNAYISHDSNCGREFFYEHADSIFYWTCRPDDYSGSSYDSNNNFSNGYESNYPVILNSYTSTWYFGNIPFYSGDYGNKAGMNAEIKPVRDGIAAVANLKVLATDAKLVYDKALATCTYVDAYLNLYREAEDKGWDLGLMSLNDTINATTGLSGDLWGECSTFNASLFGAARNDNTLSQLLGASSAGLSNGITLDKALASNYGQYQIDWRQEAGLDTTWAVNVKSARDAYFTALGGATTGFDTTLTGAVQDYHDTMLEAQITRSQSHFDAQKALYLALESAVNAYSLSSFDAAKVASLAYLDAAIAEILSNAQAEKEAKRKEKDHYAGIANEQEGILDGVMKGGQPSGVLGGVQTMLLYISPGDMTGLGQAAADATTAYNNALAAKPARDAAMNKAISDAKTANASARKSSDTQTTKTYTQAESTAWNTYYAAALAAEKFYLTTYVQIENTFNNAKKAADTTYTTTVVPAAVAYEKELCRLQGLFQDAIGQANLGYGVDSTYYALGATSTNVQVCFAAGYEIELADGTKKNIEDFDGTEEIWARPHDNPEGPLQKCKVVRAFKNGIKETMLVKFDNGLELRGTAEHPFYVQNKGWVPAGELSVGDICYDKEQRQIIVREIIRDNKQVEVYNIEVENCHTYYIGKDGLEVLVHNWCLFGEKWVTPWNPEADWNLWNNAKQYGRATKRAAIGTASGTIAGGTTGAGVGAIAGGVVSGGPGALPGAGAGAFAGGIGGGVSGFITAAFAKPDDSWTTIVTNSAIGGTIDGVIGGVFAPAMVANKARLAAKAGYEGKVAYEFGTLPPGVAAEIKGIGEITVIAGLRAGGKELAETLAHEAVHRAFFATGKSMYSAFVRNFDGLLHNNSFIYHFIGESLAQGAATGSLWQGLRYGAIHAAKDANWKLDVVLGAPVASTLIISFGTVAQYVGYYFFGSPDD